MGRSVWTHSDSIKTVFFEHDFRADDYYELIADIRYWMQHKFPSLESCDDWSERESHAILRSELAEIVISEYCGLVSLGVVPRNSDYVPHAFALAWCQNNAAPFIETHYSKLRPIATGSNGITMYERIE